MKNVNILDSEKLVFTIDDFFTKDQCENLITKTEQQKYEVAPITVGYKAYELQLENRNNDRVIIDDEDFAEELFNKIKEYLPLTFKGWSLKGLNERFRFYRYTEGQKFEVHRDGRFRRDIDNESKLTLLVYLSDEVEGGETGFYTKDLNLRFKVKPTIGQVLVFDHNQMHSGEPVINGTKYVLRTDVMYSRCKL